MIYRFKKRKRTKEICKDDPGERDRTKCLGQSLAKIGADRQCGGRDTQLKSFQPCTAHEPMRESTNRLLLRHGSIRNGMAYVTFAWTHPLAPRSPLAPWYISAWEEKKGWEWRWRDNLLEIWLIFSFPVYRSRSVHHATPRRQCLLLPRPRKA